MWNQNYGRGYGEEVYLGDSGQRSATGQFYDGGVEADSSYENSEVFLDYQSGLDTAAYDRFGTKLEQNFAHNVATMYNDTPEPVFLNQSEFSTAKPNSSYITWNNEVYLMNDNCYLYNNSLIPNQINHVGYQKTKKMSLSNYAYTCGQYDDDKDSAKFWMATKSNQIKMPTKPG